MFKEINRLKLFFEEPEREFHLRELARLLKKNPVTVKKYLLDFVKEKILLVKKQRGLELYSSNTENLLYKEFKKTYNKIRLIESGLLEYLDEHFNYPTIVLFGSYERGEDNKKGDIDIFIMSEIKKYPNLNSFNKKFNREIQIHLMGKRELEKNKKTNPELINSIINGSILRGFLEVL